MVERAETETWCVQEASANGEVGSLCVLWCLGTFLVEMIVFGLGVIPVLLAAVQEERNSRQSSDGE